MFSDRNARRMGRLAWPAIALGGTVVAIGAIVLSGRRAKQPPNHVALIGDSYAVGLGPELTKLIPDFKFEGHVGTNTAQWANHTAACGQCGDWLTSFKPKIVLVALGVNDGATPNIANYQRIMQGLNGIGAKVIWIEPPEAVNTRARNVIRSLGVTRVAPTRTLLGSDGLHPQRYDTWAREIAMAVAQ